MQKRRHERAKKNACNKPIETGEEIRVALDLIRERTREGKAELLWVEETLRSAALAHAARILGIFYSVELPKLIGLETPEGCTQMKTRHVLSTVGDITYKRAYTATIDSDGKKHRSFPLDEALGITQGCTPAMASMMSLAVAVFGSYEDAATSLKRLAGIETNDRRVQRLVNSVAEQESTWIASREREKIDGGILNLQCDMTGIRMRPEELIGVSGKDGADPKKCQIKVGTVFRQQTNSKGEIEQVPGSTTRVVTFGNVLDLSLSLMDEACKRGYHDAETIVFTSDGAPWIWIMVEDRFKGAVQIVYFYHATEHLGILCNLAETHKEKALILLRKRRTILKNWGADSLIRFFTDLAQGHEKQEEIKKALGYFIDNQSRMKYREFRQKGYFIGSGVIEGSCKCLINQRTDLGGQRWLKTGSVNVLRIRAAVQDNLHDLYWKSVGAITVKAG